MSKAEHYTTAPEDRISLKQKSAYAVGMLVNNLQAAALPAMVVILNLGLGMDVLWVGIIGAIPRIFDAVSDPMLGYISDNTRTRWGRRRPFILVGALVAGLIFALMWQLPSGYINLFTNKTVVQYENPSPNKADIIFREGQSVVINYDKEQPSESGVVFYGPRALMSKAKLVKATDFREYASVELDAEIPEGLSMDIIFNEAGVDPEASESFGTIAGDDGESFHLEVTSNELEEGVFAFNFSELKPHASYGNQSGKKQLDTQAIKNIIVRFPELQGSGAITIGSFKLHKDPDILNRQKSLSETIAGIFKEDVATVDILNEPPLSQHESLIPNDTTILYRSGGGTVLSYSADAPSDASFVFYGPETFALENTPAYATNLDGFPQIEINSSIPENQSFSIFFDEAGVADAPSEAFDTSAGDDGESYSIDLSPEKVDGNLYQFGLEDLKQRAIYGNQSGNKELDTQAVKNVTVAFTGLQGKGTISIDSFKLKKPEGFFVHYFWYFMGMSILFFLAYTVYATPFVAFGYEMTPDYHERTRLHAFANTVGQLAWLGVPWFYAIMASSLFRDTVHGARTLAIAVGAVVALFGIVPAIFCRERQSIAPVEKAVKSFWQNMSEFFKGIGTTFKCSPFVKLCGATFLVFNGFQLGMSFSIYVMIYYVFFGNDLAAGKLMGWFGMLTSIATLCVIPLTGWIATRIGKRRTFLITISLSIVGYALKWVGYNPEHPYWLLYAAPFVAFGTGSLFTLMGSMISDVCDYDELVTHQRREGVFGAIYWWMVKVGMALAGLLTGVLLKVSGFDQALGAGQEEKTLFLLRVFDVGVPLVTSPTI
ncbi:MAG: MFS transporter [Planctomycetota bacterium]|jgi:GPH family glycoside/pentoside/hexuronide:cation symporter